MRSAGGVESVGGVGGVESVGSVGGRFMQQHITTLINKTPPSPLSTPSEHIYRIAQRF